MPKVSLTRASAIAGSLLLAGLLLRLFFVHRYAFLASDSILYQEIAQNLLHEHTYGLSTDTVARPTLIRLPGYPMVLAILDLGVNPLLHAEPGTLRSFLPVLLLQVFVDLLTCIVLANLAGRLFGARAKVTALAIGCLCPFLANYTAVPLTETFTLFTIAATFSLLEKWRRQPGTKLLLALAAALSFSILLRPDQGLLTAAVLPCLIVPDSSGTFRGWRSAVLCAALVALPFVPWTIRNARTFGVFQPLAPRLANDPGETVPLGFQRWFRTFGVDFCSTEDAYWKYPEEPVNPDDLPRRAFDTPAQEAATRTLLEEAAAYNHLVPELDARFGRLAQERIAASPLRQYLFLPVARLTDMLLRPRVEMLPVEDRWWEFRRHPGQTVFAGAYAALNLSLFLAALYVLPLAFRRDRVLTSSICAYILLRCALLLTLDNAEQRYTMELLPPAILFASALAARTMGDQRLNGAFKAWRHVQSLATHRKPGGASET